VLKLPSGVWGKTMGANAFYVFHAQKSDLVVVFLVIFMQFFLIPADRK